MFDDIQKELAKLIAHGLYDAATNLGRQARKELKNADLKKGGRGLPPPILAEFERSFVAALDNKGFNSDGEAKWLAKKGEEEFEFLLRDPLVDSISKTDWANAAISTSNGVKLVKALGGETEFNAAIARHIGLLFDRAITASVGNFVRCAGSYGFYILSNVITTMAAKKNTADFRETRLFYWKYSTEEKARATYKRAKKVMYSGVISKSLKEPSAGPFLD